MIELEMQELSVDDKRVILGSEFNAKTGTVVDFSDIEYEEKTNLVKFFKQWKPNQHLQTRRTNYRIYIEN